MTDYSNAISFVLTGGSSNIDPDSSLGGNPSNRSIASGLLNNLFSDVSTDQNESGYEDYRCIYIWNDSTDSFEISLWTTEEPDVGSNITVGILSQNEIQRIVISPIPTSGSFILMYGGEQAVCEYDINSLGQNVQNALNGLSSLNGVIVTQTNSTSIVLDVKFAGEDGIKSHPLLTSLQDINHSLFPDASIAISLIQQGYPVNTIPELLSESTTAPVNVSFTETSSTYPIIIPKLNPEDGFPLWVKRSTIAGTISKSNDGFVLKIKGRII
jgi:hypothetical protein